MTADTPHGDDQTTLSGAGTPIGSNLDSPQIRGFEIHGRLGEGGMGVVWKATQLSTNRVVALKVMKTVGFGAERTRLRFEREIELAASLSHPFIARVYDSGLQRHPFYYAMELVEGLPLDKYIQQHAFGEHDILVLMQKVSDAIAFAHQRGVIHRDIKPSNIVVTDDGQPHVLDFGLAKSLQVQATTDLTIEGEIAGTPLYMAPEQAAGELNRITTRTDVYALGVVLYRLLTGDHPHDTSGTRHQFMRRVIEQDAVRPRARDRRINSELDAILLKSLAREPEQRYASAAELQADLERYLAGEPIAAKPPTTAYFLTKRLRKHRVPVTIATVFIFALFAVAVWAYVRVNAERNVAIENTRLAEQREAEANAERLIAERNLGFALIERAQRMAEENQPLEALLCAGRALGWAEVASHSYQLRPFVAPNSEEADVAREVIAWRSAAPKWDAGHVVRTKFAAPRIHVNTTGTRLAVTGTQADLLFEVYDAQTLERVATYPSSAVTYRRFIAHHPTKPWVATSGRLIDYELDRVLLTVDEPYPNGSFSFSPDGSMLAAGIYIKQDGKTKGRLILYDLRTMSEIRRVEVDANISEAVMFNSTGTRLAAGTGGFSGNRLLVWDVESWQSILNRSMGTAYLRRPRFTPDGSSLMLHTPGSYGERLTFVDVENNDVRHCEFPNTAVNGPTLSNDGQLVYFSDYEGRIQVFSHLHADYLEPMPGHRDSIADLTVDPVSGTLYSADFSGYITRWPLPQQRLVNALHVPRKDWPNGLKTLKVGPTGQFVYIQDDTKGGIWRVSLNDNGHKRFIQMPLPWRFHPVPNSEELDLAKDRGIQKNYYRISNEDRVVTFGSFAGEVFHLSAIDSSVLARWDTGDGYLRDVEVSPDGRTVITLSSHKLKVWRLSDLTDTKSTASESSVADLLWSKDIEFLKRGGHAIITLSMDQKMIAVAASYGIEVCNAANGDTVFEDAVPNVPISAVQFGRENRYLIVTSFWGGSTWLRDLKSGRVLHKYNDTKAVFPSPHLDAVFVAQAGGDLELRTVPEDRLVLRLRWPSESPVGVADISADGSAIATHHEDGTIRITRRRTPQISDAHMKHISFDGARSVLPFDNASPTTGQK